MYKQTAAHFLLLGWLLFLAAALPTTTPPSISLTSEDISLHLNITHLSPLNSSQVIHYSVPQTQVALIIYTGAPISGPAMRDTIEDCLAAAHAVMLKYGDVYMFPDPYVFKTPSKSHNGLAIRAYSLMVPGLHWTDLVDTLQGIYQVTWQRAIYKVLDVKMYHEPSLQLMGGLDFYKSPAIDQPGTDDLA